MEEYVKTKATYFTQEKIENARKNIERYDWARKMKDAAVEKADRYVQLGLEKLWKAVTPQSVPRSTWVNKDDGSPVTGRRFLKEFGHHGWDVDPYRLSWKIKDRSSGYIFPANDFASFYESGLDERGIFNRELADPQYLVNELYPEKGEKWGVDDGFGWVDEDGKKFVFVAYYNDQHIWGFGPGIVASGLTALTEAFLFTGDLRYAQAGIVLLDRVADLYPEMDSSVYKWEEGFYHSHGLTWKGKVFGCIAECILLWHLLPAYDAFFDAVEKADVVDFLHAKAVRYGLSNQKRSVAAIRRNIEEGLIRQVFPAMKNAQIRGNFGMHQRALAQAAVILDEEGTSEQWIDWLFQTGGLAYEPELHLTGGNLMATLVEDIDRDGAGNESSPHYNMLWIDQLKPTIDVLEHYGHSSKTNLYNHVKMKKMFDSFYPLTMLNRYLPPIGDTEKTGNPAILGNPGIYVEAFEKYREPVYAQYAYLLNGNKLEGLRGNLFSAEPGRTLQGIAEVIETHGPLRLESTNLTGYGFTALRHNDGGTSPDDGRPGAERGMWMYYGRNAGHGHRDALNIGLYAYELDLMPDHGNPETKDGSPKGVEWNNNTISHNTVVVDRSKQRSSWVGIPHHYEGSGNVQFIDVSAPDAYPDVGLYRRTIAFIRIDAERSYAVDFFRVKGGKNHHYSFHAAEGDVRVEGLCLKDQGKGSYAGEYIDYGLPDGKQPQWYGRNGEYTGSGFHYLDRVQRDENPSERFSIDWTIRDTWGARTDRDGDIHLRLTLTGRYDEIALADGAPPRLPGNPDKLKYLIARRGGEALESQFVAVIEPYKNARSLASIERASLMAEGEEYIGHDAAAVKLVHADGRCDYIVHSLRGDVQFTVDGRFDFQGCFAFYSEKEGKPVYGYLNDGTLLESRGRVQIRLPEGSWCGEVADFTKEFAFRNTITVRIRNGSPAPGDLADRWIYVKNDGARNAVYQIKAVHSDDRGLFTLDIGDTTLIRKYKNKHEFSEGYVYDLSEGDEFYIPISAEWKSTL